MAPSGAIGSTTSTPPEPRTGSPVSSGSRQPIAFRHLRASQERGGRTVDNIMSSKLFTTRQGTVLLGVIAAVIAAIALIAYLNHYRNSVAQPEVKVLVAN